jgi:phosphoribosylaminoimidazole-succinocarboxamide synthase
LGRYAHELFALGQRVALEKGLILVDTKYEFGKDEAGNIIIVDEIHTPDSSRYWIAETFEQVGGGGEKQPEWMGLGVHHLMCSGCLFSLFVVLEAPIRRPGE